jgi:drug/metabolite transporter (DMT)-like permease
VPDLEGGTAAAAIGVVMVFIAVLSRAGSSVYARRFLKGVDPLQSAVGMLTTAAIAVIPLSLILDDPLTIRPSAQGILYTVILGIFASGLANLLLFWLIANRGATFTSLYSCIEPAVAVWISVMFLGDHIQAATLVGMVVLIVCIIVINGYLGKGKVISQGRGGA